MAPKETEKKLKSEPNQICFCRHSDCNLNDNSYRLDLKKYLKVHSHLKRLFLLVFFEESFSFSHYYYFYFYADGRKASSFFFSAVQPNGHLQ
jgi:hypothetical protein